MRLVNLILKFILDYFLAIFFYIIFFTISSYKFVDIFN